MCVTENELNLGKTFHVIRLQLNLLQCTYEKIKLNRFKIDAGISCGLHQFIHNPKKKNHIVNGND